MTEKELDGHLTVGPISRLLFRCSYASTTDEAPCGWCGVRRRAWSASAGHAFFRNGTMAGLKRFFDRRRRAPPRALHRRRLAARLSSGTIEVGQASPSQRGPREAIRGRLEWGKTLRRQSRRGRTHLFRGLISLGLCLSTVGCLARESPLESASAQFRHGNDYVSLVTLLKLFHPGMPRQEVERLIGEPDYSPMDGLYYSTSKTVCSKEQDREITMGLWMCCYMGFFVLSFALNISTAARTFGFSAWA